jgi:hypothetical protein
LLARVEEPTEALDEAPNLVVVDLILGSEVIQHLVARGAGLGIAHLLRKLEVGSSSATREPPRNAPDVHAPILKLKKLYVNIL